jgi:hypothetical protein
MDLPHFLALMRSRWRLIAAIALAAALAGPLSLGRPTAIRLAPTHGSADHERWCDYRRQHTNTGEIRKRAATTNLALASLDTVAVRVARQFPSVSAGELNESVPIDAAGEWDCHRDCRTPLPRQAAACQRVALARSSWRFRRRPARPLQRPP